MMNAARMMAVLMFIAAAAFGARGAASAGERLYAGNFSIGLPCGWDVLLGEEGRRATLVLPGGETAIMTVRSYENASGAGLDEIWSAQRDFMLSRCDCEDVRESDVTVNGVVWKRLDYVDRYTDEGSYNVTMFAVKDGYCFRVNYTAVTYKTYMDHMPDFQEVASDIRLFDAYSSGKE